MEKFINKPTTLKESTEYAEIDGEERKIKFLVRENVCIVCKTKWITIFINDIIVFGCEISRQNKGVFVSPICSKCIEFGDNSPATKFLNSRIRNLQIEDWGYKYKYRWVINTTQPFEFEYVWIKEPTIEGFMDFLKRRLGEK